MIRSFIKYIVVFAAAVQVYGCIYDFVPDDVWDYERAFVIEGDIILGDYSYFKISKSITLSELEEVEYITDADVWVEDSKGNRWSAALSQDRTNSYAVNTSSLDISEQYKLCVSISGRGRYESQLSSVNISPAIDSITCSTYRQSARVAVTTHGDDNGGDIYCKWNYEEDWEIVAPNVASLIYIPGSGMMEISSYENEQRRLCWGKGYSSLIHIGNSEKLSENLIFKEELKYIDGSDNRMSKLYAITVTQIALSKEAYKYWETLKTNSTEAGGLFAPQPNELRGNIYSVDNPGEFVLGYISVSTASKERFFIDGPALGVYNPGRTCNSSLVDRNLWSGMYHSGYSPLYYDDGNSNKAWWVRTQCVDCRVLGSKKKPSFWPI